MYLANGHRKGRQCYKCKHCGRQFLDHYRPWQYSNDVKQLCLKMYLCCLGTARNPCESQTFTTRPSCIGFEQQVCHYRMPHRPLEIPKITDLDELQTFVGNKRNKLWIWTALNHFQAGILAWTVGDSPKATLRERSAQTFKPLWLIVKCFGCFFYLTDGWSVYQMFIQDGDYIVSKTYMTPIDGENTRLRHYLARLDRKTLCYSKSIEMLKCSLRLKG
ncbi:MAG: IS1 family transposase [Cyanobacteriota bacterium]